MGQFRDADGKIQLNLTVVNETQCSSYDRPRDSISCNERCYYEWRLGQFREVWHMHVFPKYR